jgi:hypothetical protein
MGTTRRRSLLFLFTEASCTRLVASAQRGSSPPTVPPLSPPCRAGPCSQAGDHVRTPPSPPARARTVWREWHRCGVHPCAGTRRSCRRSSGNWSVQGESSVRGLRRSHGSRRPTARGDIVPDPLSIPTPCSAHFSSASCASRQTARRAHVVAVIRRGC